MHSQSTVAQALVLRHEGLGARRIASRLSLPVSTVRDWLAGSLPAHSRPGDPRASRRCTTCGLAAHDFDDLMPDYVYLLGLYLGDGSIATHPRGVYRLRISLDIKYPGIIQSAAMAIEGVRAVRASVQRCNGNYVEVNSYWKAWPCFFPQHAPGKKQDRRITLTEWQRELVNRWPKQLLRGLIHSDGCRFQNTGRCNWVHPRYSFTQVSDDIRRIFCDTCELLGLRWTASGNYTIYVSRKVDVAKLDKFVGPKA